jgi:hypothetical protein
MSFALHPSPAGYAPPGAARPGVRYETVLSFLVFVWLSTSSISFIEPSPYDFLSLVAIPAWFFGGVRVHRSAIFILLLWTIYNVLGVAAVLPYWHEPDPRIYQLQSVYLFVTVVVFTLYFSERAETRYDIAMSGFAVSAVFASMVGIIGYLNIAGLGEYTTRYEGRVSGTFKDPNVLGSFMILAISFLYSKLVLGNTKRPLLNAIALLICLVGLFLSFSRGAWAASILAMGTVTIFAFLAAQNPAQRARVVYVVLSGLAAVVVGLAAILADTETRELLLLRASATQDYDVGETGRFGNQMRAVRELLGEPFGYGPLRLRLTFGLDPHNSYIGAFANYGWIGGFLWLVICGSTMFVGFRMMVVKSPFRLLAIGATPGLFALLAQGMQIDVDHWRFLFLGFGAVWGLEIARQRWLASQPAR